MGSAHASPAGFVPSLPIGGGTSVLCAAEHSPQGSVPEFPPPTPSVGAIPEPWENFDATLAAQSGRSLRIPDMGNLGTEEERGAQLEAMRILRQVEMEVRNLKGWYSAAISAIKETEKFMAAKTPDGALGAGSVDSFVAIENCASEPGCNVRM